MVDVQPSENVPHEPAGKLAQVIGLQLLAQVPAVEPDGIEHEEPAAQVPHTMVPPQPSATEPQLLLPQAAAWVLGVQPHWLAVPPPPQVAPVPVQLFGEHVTVPPQPFGIVPQLSPAGHAVSGWQTQVPAAEQVKPAWQAPLSGPQDTVPPQPSGAVPHVWLPQATAADDGVHLHTLDEHTSLGCVQVPQLTVGLGQPAGFVMLPQVSPAGQVVAQVWHVPVVPSQV